jgi:hypothetical protein
MKIRFALFALLLSLAMFAAVMLRPKPNPVQKPNPATAIVDSTGGAMPVWDSKPNSTTQWTLFTPCQKVSTTTAGALMTCNLGGLRGRIPFATERTKSTEPVHRRARASPGATMER